MGKQGRLDHNFIIVAAGLTIEMDVTWILLLCDVLTLSTTERKHLATT